MKKFVFIISILAGLVYFVGCSKRQESLEEMQVPMSTEVLSAIETETKTQPELKSQIASLPQAQTSLESLPPTGPYKPTAQEIQTALKNAGLYTGRIDGKIGPLTKKAIEDFQRANDLGVDGKIGPKTWAALGKYLNPAPVTNTKQ